MTDDNSRADKPTDRREVSLHTCVNEKAVASKSTTKAFIEAGLGAWAQAELDSVNTNRGTVTTRVVTPRDDVPLGIELGLTVGTVQTTVVLDTAAATSLATKLTDAVETLQGADTR